MIFRDRKNILKIVGISILLSAVSFSFSFPNVNAQDVSGNSNVDEAGVDHDLYQKYLLYQKYQKRQKYKKYKVYKKYKKKYKFKSKSERKKYKDQYKKYKKYKKNRSKYPQYAKYYDGYKKYKKYKNKYKKYRKYKSFSKYKKYNKKSYNKYNKYGTAVYKAGYNRYRTLLTGQSSDSGEADLGGGSLGPDITIGLWYYTRDGMKSNPFKIDANKDYNVKDRDGNLIGKVAASTSTRVTYDGDKKLKVYRSVGDTLSTREVYFDAADGDNSSMIFNVHRPNSSFDEYRGRIKLRYSNDTKRIWVINTLPMEQYTWGMGETSGTGDMDFNRVMAVSFRTYGYWKLKFSTKYASEGFKVNATPGNQLYYGYEWEKAHSRIRTATEDTRGKIVMYRSKIAITPYSSWTDGRTRSFKERWGSSNYPWCKSVKDSYGKHPSKSTSTLVKEGNHMVGLSANGALKLADDKGWDWDRILKYYYSGISIVQSY